ncbi:hypothetical protein [Plebeiibacterium sediminum]|uniref:Uncharacterized protein n=1 Tax=Plebeiibacterium sediminum TaxID=2992112 RepID=A0AAE3M7Q9_9BACT|nr:hypothetical protein [Plebeiobacterium sediminum]MCW3788804.1 hypothetical protein [Plebeiobacterium sediminum]
MRVAALNTKTKVMNYLKTAFLIFFLLPLIISSCSEDSIPENSDIENTLKNIWVENGVLHVNSESTLDSLVLSNLEKTEDQLIEWQNSLDFENYQSFYNNVFDEYELMVEDAISKESDEPYFDFVAKYSEFVEFPSEPILGAPNRSMEPLVKSSFNTVVNKLGYIYVGDELINYTNKENSLKSSTSSYYCYKKTSKRKMKVTAEFGPNVNKTTIHCGCKKKTLWAWWSYTTTFWARPNSYGIWTKWKAYDGDVYYPTWVDVRYMEIFTDGVKSENKCIFPN